MDHGNLGLTDQSNGLERVKPLNIPKHQTAKTPQNYFTFLFNLAFTPTEISWETLNFKTNKLVKKEKYMTHKIIKNAFLILSLATHTHSASDAPNFRQDYEVAMQTQIMQENSALENIRNLKDPEEKKYAMQEFFQYRMENRRRLQDYYNNASQRYYQGIMNINNAEVQSFQQIGNAFGNRIQAPQTIIIQEE